MNSPACRQNSRILQKSAGCASCQNVQATTEYLYRAYFSWRDSSLVAKKNPAIWVDHTCWFNDKYEQSRVW
jgi:hypothetical protein